MSENYLITGYWGEPHVTAENDRGINAAIFGAGRFVLPVGEQFAAEYIGNNTIRIYDGKLMDNGAAAGIPAGEYVDLLISNAGQGMKRNDLIVFQYQQDASTMVESGIFTVVQGTETSGTAADPALTQADLLSGNATFDQMALWRVPVSGTAISAPVQVFTVAPSIGKMLPKSGGTMTGAIAMGGNKVTGLGAPTNDNDAATKAYVDENGLKPTKLWENTDATATFEPQTISLDLSKYRAVVILTQNTTTSAIIAQHFALIGAGECVLTVPAGFNRYRACTVTAAGVTFAEGRVLSTYSGSTTENNAAVIPTAIYGL